MLRALILVLLLPLHGFAQTKEIQNMIADRLASVQFVLSLEDPRGGFRPKASDPKKEQHIPATLGATSAAVRALKYLGAKVPNPEKHAAFVLTCFDPQSGGFAEIPRGTETVYTTSVGVMAAVELGIPKEKFAKAMTFIHEKANSFEEARIAAAAVESWGVRDCPFPLDPWFTLLEKIGSDGTVEGGDDSARLAGATAAMRIRLGKPIENTKPILEVIENGRRDDGAWGRLNADGSDLESTYRVIRGFHMMKTKPKDTARLREFLQKCSNPDGGYGISPGEPSGVGPVYFATIITHWLDGMEK